MSFYSRIFAWFYHHVMSGNGAHDHDDPMTRDIRIPMIGQATGSVLEIGAGNGANLTLYPEGVSLTFLDPNPHMLRYLDENAAKLGINGYQTVQAPAESIPFPDDCFDTVVATHVLCSVADLPSALSEIRRVLRPGGRFFFLEHVSASPDTSAHRLQKFLNPAWKVVGDGCHLTRDTGQAVRMAGFDKVEVTDYAADYPSIISPHVYGWAQA